MLVKEPKKKKSFNLNAKKDTFQQIKEYIYICFSAFYDKCSFEYY